MRFGIIGLGEMGGNLGLQAIGKGHSVVGFDANSERVKSLAHQGIDSAFSLDELLHKLDQPRLVLLYLPHGRPLDTTVQELRDRMEPGDMVADGGNTHWKESIRHYENLKSGGVAFLDVGTSGGVEGARNGACFMVGGDADAFAHVQPLLEDLAVAEGVVHAGPAGSGHFVKLVHNAIEFGMVQAIGEGLDLLRQWEHPLDLPAVFHNWNHGSVIRSWLVELMERALRQENLNELSSYVEDTREVKWVVEFALDKELWIPVTAQSELAFYRYRDPDSIAAKGVALLRHMYGGHPLHRKSGG